MLQGLLGIFSGLITPVQTAVNTRLGRSIGSPLRASLVSFSVGLIAMLTLTLLLGPYPLIPPPRRTVHGGCGSRACSVSLS